MSTGLEDADGGCNVASHTSPQNGFADRPRAGQYPSQPPVGRGRTEIIYCPAWGWVSQDRIMNNP